MIFAERVSDVPIFRKSPQQSDYVDAWANREGNRLAFFDHQVAQSGRAKEPSMLKRLVPESLLRFRRVIMAGRHATSAPDQSQFRPFDPRA
jgi:hypothetical protein